jgi:hypothetical protein
MKDQDWRNILHKDLFCGVHVDALGCRPYSRDDFGFVEMQEGVRDGVDTGSGDVEL